MISMSLILAVMAQGFVVEFVPEQYSGSASPVQAVYNEREGKSYGCNAPFEQEGRVLIVCPAGEKQFVVYVR